MSDSILPPIPGPPIAKVVRLEPGKQTDFKHTSNHCWHRQYEVDENARMVECANCGAVLDPFEIIRDYAHRERHWRYLDNEAREAEKRLAALKEEERKVKARTKNADRKTADVAVAAERAKLERMRISIIEQARDARQLLNRIEALAAGRSVALVKAQDISQ